MLELVQLELEQASQPEVEQQELLEQAQASLSAAQLLHKEGYLGFAASRAYYAMFYVAQAFLLSKGLSFSKHTGVVSAFGQHFGATGEVPSQCHRQLIEAMELRHIGDYGPARRVTPQRCQEVLRDAEEFIKLGQSKL